MKPERLDDIRAFLQASKNDNVPEDRVRVDLEMFLRSLATVNDDPSLRSLSTAEVSQINDLIMEVYQGNAQTSEAQPPN